MITAYDATFASIVDESGVDIILVGDSVGSVVQGVANTIPVTLEEMEYHVRLVSRANPRALLVGDLPFGSYQVNSEQGVRSAIRLIKAGANVLLLDEPASALDPISTGKLEETIVELKKDYTIVIVTHNLQQAARIADHTGFMYLGHLIEFAPTADVFSNPKSKRTADYVGGQFG